jgi:hypothetical protein
MFLEVIGNETIYRTFQTYYQRIPHNQQPTYLEKSQIIKRVKELKEKLSELGQTKTETILVEREIKAKVQQVNLKYQSGPITVKLKEERTYQVTISEEEIAVLIVYSKTINDTNTYNQAIEASGRPKILIEKLLEEARKIY